MIKPASIFLDFAWPNATTWFYFSFILAIALFFKFSRLLSIRNWDVCTIFLLVPGLLFLQQGRQQQQAPEPGCSPTDVGTLVLQGGQQAAAPAAHGAATVALLPVAPDRSRASSTLWLGYLWLVCGSVYLLLRCLWDLILVRRPALTANLNCGGLAWLAVALFLCLSIVAFRPSPHEAAAPTADRAELLTAGAETVGRPTAPVAIAQTTLRPYAVVARSFAVACHLSVVLGLVLIGAWHFHNAPAGMAAATFYLLLPYTGYFVGQVHHVWPMALMVWAIAFYRSPYLAGLFLGLAAGTAFFPALVLPIWFSFYWRRGAGRFSLACLAAAGTCLAATGLVLWLNNDLARTLSETLALPDWQPWKWQIPAHEGFWTGVHWAYRMPVFILYVTLVITTAFWPNPKDLAHVIALSTAVLVGLQLWYADRGGVYVLWYLPFFLLMVFRPNLSDRRPAGISPEPNVVRRTAA